MEELVTVEISQNVARVKLNRPEKYNAISREMIVKIYQTGLQLNVDRSVRAVVISGEGPGFCSGLDFVDINKMADGTMKFDLFERPPGNPANYGQLVGYIWKQLPVPVIAALHGAALGGGFHIALGADIRLASPDASFSFREINWGLTPDMAGFLTLRNLVSIDVAKELTYTGRAVDAAEALHLGLVTRICKNPLEEADKLAREIASKSPDAISSAKFLLDEIWGSSLEDGLLLEEKIQRSLMGTPNQTEAVQAYNERRHPLFTDRS